MKCTFLWLLLCVLINADAQYIAVKARYTATKLVDDAPNPPKRENRLILSFYEVHANGNYLPANLLNYDLYVFKSGNQYGSYLGGVNDSTGNNYPGYTFTAPVAVSYYNTQGLNYIDCDPNAATHYIANGSQLDCGWVTVSYWENGNEFFTAPNICLPYYQFPSPYATSPGNVNFYQPIPATPPYNFYNYSCGGTMQTVIRGVLPADTSSSNLISLPVLFADVKGAIDANDLAKISWSNLTEHDVSHYEVDISDDGINFHSIRNIPPSMNTGGRADYHFSNWQVADKTYYRIKAVENNGRIYYSTIISLAKLLKPAALTIYPNPVANGLLNIRLSTALPGRYIFYVVNAASQRLHYKIISHNGGELLRSIEMTGLPPGIYQLVLQSTVARYTQTIVHVR